MDRSNLLRQPDFTTIVSIVIFSLVLTLRLSPFSPALAIQSNETMAGPSKTIMNDGISQTAVAHGNGPPSPCDPQDPACPDNGGGGGAPPPCDPRDPSCGVSPCDPQDPACPDNGGGGGAPPPCDPRDPSCGVSPCDPQDPACADNGGGGGAPPPCDPRDPSCGVSPCDLQDPACPPATQPPPSETCNDGIDNDGNGIVDDPSQCSPGGPIIIPPAFHESHETCNDGIDNDGNGIIDDTSQCSPGGPCTICVPGGIASIPNQQSPVGDPNILSAAFETNLLPGLAEATLPTETNCNDGIDNDRDSLKDLEDPSCNLADLLQTELTNAQVSHASQSPVNTTTKKRILFDSQGVGTPVTPVSPLNTEKKIVVISILGNGNINRHDIRTASLQYKYSLDKITIGKDTTVKWVNNDFSQSHGIDIINRLSGKTIFTYPVIRPGTSVDYIFASAGQYIYTDPKYPNMSGLIRVLN